MKNKIGFLTVLVFTGLTYLQAATQVVFVKGDLKHTYTIGKKIIIFKNEHAEETQKIIPEHRLADMKSELVGVSWASKAFNEKLKTKCQIYAEIKTDVEAVPVCQKDKLNVNKMFSILNEYNDIFAKK